MHSTMNMMAPLVEEGFSIIDSVALCAEFVFDSGDTRSRMVEDEGLLRLFIYTLDLFLCCSVMMF